MLISLDLIIFFLEVAIKVFLLQKKLWNQIGGYKGRYGDYGGLYIARLWKEGVLN
jgi:hypothetical protein